MSKHNNFNNFIASFKGLKLIKIIEESSWEGIYYCHYEPLNEYVQIEIIDIKEVPNTNSIYLFKKRIENLRNLKHPNIVKLIKSKISEDFGYLMLNATETVRLRDVIDKYGATSPKQALTIVKEIALALEFCHSQNSFHGEIRPSNVLISNKGRVTVRNFFIFENSNDHIVNLLNHRPEYVSPEIISFSNISYKTDIYSLGIVLYEMLIGKPPFSSDKTDDIWKMHLSMECPQISNNIPDLPELDHILKKALNKELEVRYSSVSEFILEINQALLNIPEELSFNRYNEHKIHSPHSKKSKETHLHKNSHKKNNEANEILKSPKKKISSGTKNMLTSAFSILLIGFVCYLLYNQYQSGKEPIIEEIVKNQELSPEEKKLAQERENKRYNIIKKNNPKIKKTKKTITTKNNKKKKAFETELNQATPIAENSNHELDSIKAEIEQLKAVIKKPRNEAIAYLEKSLQSPLPMIRLLANQILRDIKGNKLGEIVEIDMSQSKVDLATEMFTKINHEDPQIKLDLINNLKTSKNIEAKEYLFVLAEDNNPEVSFEALKILAQNKEEKIIPLLAKKLKDNPQDPYIAKLIYNFEEKSEKDMTPMLLSKNEDLRKRALQFTHFYDSNKVIDSLVEIINEQSSDAYRAAVSLAKGSDTQNRALLKIVIENKNQTIQGIALQALRETDISKQKNLFFEVSQKTTGEIQALAKLYLIPYSKYSENVDWDRKQTEFYLSEFKSGDRNEYCQLLSSCIGKFDDDFDLRAISLLKKMQDDAIPALSTRYKQNQSSIIRKKILSILSSIHSSDSTKTLLDIYDSSMSKYILDSIVKLDPISVKSLVKSKLPKEKIASTLARMKSKIASVQLVEYLDGLKTEHKKVVSELFKSNLEPSHLIRTILEHSKNEKLIELILDKVEGMTLKPYIVFIKKLLLKDNLSLREACFKLLKAEPELIQPSLFDIMNNTVYDDIRFSCIDTVTKDNPKIVDILNLGFISESKKVKSLAAEKYTKLNFPVSAGILELYSTEKDKKIIRNLVRYFSIPPNDKNIQYHLINYESKTLSLKKASKLFFNGLDFNKNNASTLGKALSQKYPLSIKKVILKIFYNKDPEELLQQLCEALPTENKNEAELFKKAIKGFGKKAGPNLVSKMNSSNDAVEEIKTILEEMKLSVSYNIERKSFVLD